MEIKIYGNELLRKKAKIIDKIDSEIISLSREMIVMAKQKNGVGLAATQIGIDKRLIIIDYTPDEKSIANPITIGESYLIPMMPLVLINPEIISFSKETRVYEEGCLSVPEIYANVERPKTILLKSQLIDGSEITLECGGLLSIILQHEVDHLNGVLFVDRVKPEDTRKIQKRLDKLKKQHTER